MNKILVGNTNNGWEVDNEKKTLSLYHPISFIEKMKHYKQCTEIEFSDIKCIVVGWSNIPLAFGDNQHFVLFKLKTNDNKEYDFEGTKNGVTKETFKEAIILLKKNNIIFDDQYNVLETIITSDDEIWDILNNAELNRRESQ